MNLFNLQSEMPGVVFLICVPTATYERILINGIMFSQILTIKKQFIIKN